MLRRRCTGRKVRPVVPRCPRRRGQQETPEDPPVENCRCNRELPKPGRVLIAVFSPTVTAHKAIAGT